MVDLYPTLKLNGDRYAHNTGVVTFNCVLMGCETTFGARHIGSTPVLKIALPSSPLPDWRLGWFAGCIGQYEDECANSWRPVKMAALYDGLNRLSDR